MPLPSDLLNPISADKPSGENLQYAPIYDKIKEARREDDDVPQGDWARGRKLADWSLTFKLITETLSTKTKDLQLTAWLAEAMLKREGIHGLREVLDLDRAYIENFWDSLHPELEDGDAEFRAGKLQWVGDKLEQAVKQVALTRTGLNWYQYRESRTVGSEEAADTEEKQRVRREAIAEGKIPLEQFDKDFDAAPKSFYVNLEAAFDATLESLTLLGEACDAKFGDVSPGFGTLRSVLEEVRQTVHSLLQRKREKEPDDPVDVPAAEIEEAEETPVDVEAPAAVTVARAAPVRRGALSAEPVDRDDAVARIVASAKFLRTQDPYSPAPYLLLRGLRWGELRAAGESIDETLLAPPPTEIRQRLKSLALEYNWTEVLETAETAMGLECGRGWLDVQRYACRACLEQGSYYEPIRTAIISGLRALLADYPRLPDLTMMDDTPTANSETRAWIQEEVTAPSAQEAAREPVQDEWSMPPQEETAASPGVPQPPDTYELAIQAARSGRTQDGIELLMRELGQERSGRGRFHRKVQLSQLCVSTSHENIALPILQELAAEIERRKLEDWEAPDLVARPLALLYQSLGKSGGDDEQRAKLYAWICRLDPLMALNVSR
jgi:type VI secretion system protein ImpA